MATPATDLRDHWISVDNDGAFSGGDDAASVRARIDRFLHVSKDWSRRRLVLYAHGGLVPEASALGTLRLLRAGLAHEAYPLGIVWHTGIEDVLRQVREDKARKREAWMDATKADFDLGDVLTEAAARRLRAFWDQMKQNGLAFTLHPDAAGAVLLREIARAVTHDRVEVHVVGHSAGSILLAPLVERLTAPAPEGHGVDLASWTMWAPACSMELYVKHYAPALEAGRLGRATLFTLTRAQELADTCRFGPLALYDHSLLWLVSRGFEAGAAGAVPLLGMEEFLARDGPHRAHVESGLLAHVTAPAPDAASGPLVSMSTSHGGFNDDAATLATLFALVRASPREQTRVAVRARP